MIFLINLLHTSVQMGHSSCEEIACLAVTIVQCVGELLKTIQGVSL